MKSFIIKYSLLTYKCVIFCTKQESHPVNSEIDDRKRHQSISSLDFTKKCKVDHSDEEDSKKWFTLDAELMEIANESIPSNVQLPEAGIAQSVNLFTNQAVLTDKNNNSSFLNCVNNIVDMKTADKKSTVFKKPLTKPTRKSMIKDLPFHKAFLAEMNKTPALEAESLKQIVSTNPFTHLIVKVLTNLIYYRYTIGKTLYLMKMKMVEGYINKIDFSTKHYENFTQQNFLEQYEKSKSTFVSVGKLIEIAIDEFNYNAIKKTQEKTYVVCSSSFSKLNTNENFASPNSNQQESNSDEKLAYCQFLSNYFDVAFGHGLITDQYKEGIFNLLESLFELSLYFSSNYKTTFQKYLLPPKDTDFDFLLKDYTNERHYLFYWVFEWICYIYNSSSIVSILHKNKFPNLDFTSNSNSVYCILQLYSILTNKPGDKSAIEGGESLVNVWKQCLSQNTSYHNNNNTKSCCTTKLYYLHFLHMHQHLVLDSAKQCQKVVPTESKKVIDELSHYLLKFVNLTCIVANDALRLANN